jgi:hypothetical protein
METAWIGLFGTLGGTLIGGAIGLLGPWLLQRRKEAEEKRRRRAEKLEELVAAVYEFDHWIENTRNITAFGETDLSQTASPFAKIQAIVAIYFPQFSELVGALERASDRYVVWMNTAGQARLVWSEQFQKGGSQALRDLPEFSTRNEAVEPYVKARMDLLEALTTFGSEEFAKT